ncbi:D-alanyl-D-alanine carboxypeptidase/D-alanyl-D-alanine endopeptidase [Sinisalibacter aestuarii]|uniref:D-alanyl-D-alanine carboxypeptidase n=1 Tax=Sinisalibacter aestuarii TaxID=2949426 RepID=A0ABQ5LS14_9RHOB|nr:D-alanyl-D-alanine carboxypeptidase/D-alanyl-D-alanine-endopeptidase [Sinisalibacter aestuarii]GKY87190.1 D-alanyl-D-alanine carboxypeptidase [Sinisalibacter aestuarii]
MLRGFSRRAFLGGAVSAVAGVAFAEAPTVSPRPGQRPEALGGAAPRLAALAAPSAEDLIAEARLGGEVSFAVADARTGVVLESHGADLGLPPASVTKAVTALYGLSTLGPDFRFRTQLVATGPVQAGKVQGDLILVGTGDPLLDTDALSAMVARLKAAGVSGVTGGFRVFAGMLPYMREIDPEQPDHVGYNPAVSGVNLNFNRVHFEWKRATNGWAVAMDARSDTLRPAVSMAKMSVVSRDLPTYTYREAQGGVDEWTVASTALGNAGSRWLPVRRPDLYAGEVMQVLAAAQGIRLPKIEAIAAMPSGTVLVQHESAPLSAIVREMLKYSTNLTAEVIGLTASATRGVPVTRLDASAQAMNDWMQDGFGAAGARFVDHSGLGGGSRISAADMVRMLIKAGPGGVLHGHLKEVVPQDEEGKTLSDARYSIQAKTGTLNFVSTLAGYVTGADGALLAFAIFTGDTARRARIAPEDMERPDGARAWSRRSRLLQHRLINRWAGLYGV